MPAYVRVPQQDGAIKHVRTDDALLDHIIELQHRRDDTTKYMDLFAASDPALEEIMGWLSLRLNG